MSSDATAHFHKSSEQGEREREREREDDGILVIYYVII